MNEKNPLVKELGSSRKWVNWQYKTVGNKQTKMPMGSSNKPETWSTFDELKDKKQVGFMFGVDNSFLGVDIDHCLENGKVTHTEAEKIKEFIRESDTYTEVSPSKTGLHLYFKLSESLELTANKKAPYECYSALRFFTVTGVSLHNKPKNVRTLNKEEALNILKIIGYPWGKDKRTKETTVLENSSNDVKEDDLIRKMFSAKNGTKLEELYNGNILAYGNDQSSADLSLCNHLAFWTNKDYLKIERMWLQSPLGKREKTQNREDYRRSTINLAINNCKETYKKEKKIKMRVEINEDEFEDINFDFILTNPTKNMPAYPTLCMENIAEVLRKHPEWKGKIRNDEFLEKKIFCGRDYHDEDALIVQSKISREFSDFRTVTKTMVMDALTLVSKENSFDSGLDFFKNVTWDGVPRIDTWLMSAYGVEDNKYHRDVGSNWLKGLVKRICVPGSKFDYVLVLEGKQGTKKSSSLFELGGTWHLETSASTDNKDFFMQFRGKAIVEFSEGEILSRTEVKRLKAIITTQVDTYRSPFDRTTQDHPRRCVFAMTTNNEEYLKDETGNRRWLPVSTVFERADLEWLRENREQLLAEAYVRVMIKNETTWEFEETEVKKQQDDRRITDPNAELISDWYFNELTEDKRYMGITVNQVNKEVFSNISFGKGMTVYESMRVASILKEHLKLDKKRITSNGVRCTRWYPAGMVDSQLVGMEKELTINDF